MCTYLLEYDLENERVKETMVKCAQNFENNIDIDEWTKMWKENHKMIKPVNVRENALKMFHRQHITSVRLAKMSEGNRNVCWKGKKKIKSRDVLSYVVVM